MNTVFLLSFLVLFTVAEVFAGRCKDRASPTNTFTVTDKDKNPLEEVDNCARILECYPTLCTNPKVGGSKGLCCSSCKTLKPFTCMDRITECNPGFFKRIFRKGNETIRVNSCTEAAIDFHLCASNVFGGIGNACCKSCMENPGCEDSETWTMNTRPCKGCTCKQLAKNTKKLKKACIKNFPGMDGDDKMNVRIGCCNSCSKLGYPPNNDDNGYKHDDNGE